MRYICLMFALCCLAILPFHAQDSPLITVRLINVTNGKPAVKHNILIYRINPDTHMPIAEQGLPLKGMTDENGKAVFPSASLHPTYPEDHGSNGGKTQIEHKHRLSKFVDMAIMYGPDIQCSTGLFSLDEILTTGVVGDNGCNKKFDSTKFKSVPGEVIMFVGKYHWWQGSQS